MVAGDLVLEVTEESSLGLSLLTMLIDNPFLIFEELSVLDEGLVNIGLAMGTSSTVSMSVTFNGDTRMNLGASMNMTFTVGVATSVDVTFTVRVG